MGEDARRLLTLAREQSARIEGMCDALRDAIQICRNNAECGSVDEQQAWRGMAKRLREVVRPNG